MFRVGLPEILVIILLALIFVNPKEFPSFLRKAGQLFRQIKDTRDAFTRHMQEIGKEILPAATADGRLQEEKKESDNPWGIGG